MRKIVLAADVSTGETLDACAKQVLPRLWRLAGQIKARFGKINAPEFIKFCERFQIKVPASKASAPQWLRVVKIGYSDSARNATKARTRYSKAFGWAEMQGIPHTEEAWNAFIEATKGGYQGAAKAYGAAIKRERDEESLNEERAAASAAHDRVKTCEPIGRLRLLNNAPDELPDQWLFCAYVRRGTDRRDFEIIAIEAESLGETVKGALKMVGGSR